MIHREKCTLDFHIWCTSRLHPVHPGYFGQDGTGQDRTGNDRTGQVRTGQDRTGQVRSGQNRTGEDIFNLRYIQVTPCTSRFLTIGKHRKVRID